MYTFGLNNEKEVERKCTGRGKKKKKKETMDQRYTIGNIKKFLGHCRKTMYSSDYLY